MASRAAVKQVFWGTVSRRQPALRKLQLSGMAGGEAEATQTSIGVETWVPRWALRCVSPKTRRWGPPHPSRRRASPHSKERSDSIIAGEENWRALAPPPCSRARMPGCPDGRSRRLPVAAGAGVGAPGAGGGTGPRRGHGHRPTAQSAAGDGRDAGNRRVVDRDGRGARVRTPHTPASRQNWELGLGS